MKILTWNICLDNQNQFEDLEEVIRTESPDIICLQEVDKDCVQKIDSQLTYEYVIARDFVRDKAFFLWRILPLFNRLTGNKNTEEAYLVILSKNEPINHESNILTRKPLKSIASRTLGIKGNTREYVYADINLEGRHLRIFNLHLEVATGSQQRIQEFEKALVNKHIARQNIICGDFNIFARPWLNLFVGWGFSFGIRDYLINERKRFQKVFKEKNFVNVFNKLITFPRFRLQLDHILVPKSLEVKRYEVSGDKHGSDHRYLILEI